jgi:hypothetical protein
MRSRRTSRQPRAGGAGGAGVSAGTQSPQFRREVLVTPRHLTALALASAFALAACNDDSSTNPQNQTAQVRFINALSGTNNLSVSAGGTSIGSALTFGQFNTACATVPISNTGLTFMSGSTTLSTANFTPGFVTGGKYTVIVSGTTSAPVYTVIRTDQGAPTSGQAGLRFANLTGGSTALDVFVAASGGTFGSTANATNIATGHVSDLFSVAAGSSIFRFNNTGTNTAVFTTPGGSSVTLTANQGQTIGLAPSASGSGTPRFFNAAAC